MEHLLLWIDLSHVSIRFLKPIAVLKGRQKLEGDKTHPITCLSHSSGLILFVTMVTKGKLALCHHL